MVKITDETKQVKADRIQIVCKSVDINILHAIDRKLNRCYFPCDKDIDADVYDEVKELYEAEGYKIVPTGYIGGVWQRTEDICW